MTVSPEDGQVTVLGKSVSDLQENVTITNTGISGANSVINGTLNYVTGYTGFSGKAEEQEGNYLCMRFDTDDEYDEITVELLGGTVGHPIELDSDRNCVFRITNKDTQRIRVVATHTNEDESTVSTTVTYSLKGLTLLEED